MSNKSKEENYKKEIRKKITHPTKSPARPSKNKEYNYIPPERFYTEKEEVTLRFYQTPKALFKNPAYKGLSLGPKLMYSILRDRLDMSIKNNWKDKDGFIYLVFSVEELSDILDAGVRSVIRYKKTLVEISEQLEDSHSLGFYRKIVDLVPENLIY